MVRMNPAALDDITLRPGSVNSAPPLSALEAAPRPMAWSRCRVVDGVVVLPGGFACACPEPGRVVTVPMDRGWLVHVECAPGEPEQALIAVDAPGDVQAPVDDAGLRDLAARSRERATGDDVVDRRQPCTKRLQRAWAYRRAFERLAERCPVEGGPLVPVRWVTLSYEGQVHVAGVGTLDVDGGPGRYATADGRTVSVRRVDAGDGWAPGGAVEVVIGPARIRVKSSARCVPL